MIRNRILLKWKEPRFAYKYAKKQISQKDWLVAFTKFVGKFTLAGMIIDIGIQIFRSSKIPYSALELLMFTGFSTFAGIFFGFLFLIIDRKSPQVSIREKGIMFMAADGGWASMPYKTIQSCSIVKNKIEEKEFDILEIKLWDGNTFYIEIDPNTKTESVVKILKSKEIQIKPSLLKLI
jgi:hypothetical protein